MKSFGRDNKYQKALIIISDGEDHEEEAGGPAKGPYTGEWYVLGQFGKLRLSIGYYVDALTVSGNDAW